jgi:V/A-type H+/Na+-transporting ATPase subunit D
MRDAGPTRAALLEMQEERRALHDGHVFLDEKCLLLAGEMLRQLQRHAVLEAALQRAHAAAVDALRAALGRHGLDGLQVQPPSPLGAARLVAESATLMGVPLQQARWQRDAAAQPPQALAASPELRILRQAFAALLEAALPCGAVSGNLERLSKEYRRSVRRARALQDVLLPELERTMAGIDSALDEGERLEALAMRHGRV